MTQREWTVQDYLTFLRRWRVLIGALAVAGGLLAYSVSRFIPNRYKSQTLVLVEQPTVPTDFVRPVVSDDTNARLATMKQQLLSRKRLEPIIRQFGLSSDDANQVSLGDAIAKLQAAIEVTPITLGEGEGSSVKMPGFYISVFWDNPRTAQELCTAVTSMFIQEDIRLRQQNNQDTTQFMVQELSDAKAKLDEQDSKLAAFEAQHMGSLPDQMQTSFQILTGLYSQLDATTQALTQTQLDKSLAQSMLTQQIAQRQASQTGKNPETFGEELAALQTQLATLQARYTDDYPDVVKTRIEIEALKKKMSESEDSTKAAELDGGRKGAMEPLQFVQLRAQIRTDDQTITAKTKEQERLQEQIKSAQARVQASPDIEQHYKELTRDYQTALEFYKDLLNKRAQSEMAGDLQRRQEGERFTVLDPANLPDKPDFPNRPQFALGGVGGGLALGLGLAFLLELRDTSLRTERDVESFLQLPVLAMVPAIEHLSGKSTTQGVGQLMTGSDLESGVAG
jgi:polysaccharide chain length determinant protein (PEP-CTERM system associated)